MRSVTKDTHMETIAQEIISDARSLAGASLQTGPPRPAQSADTASHLCRDCEKAASFPQLPSVEAERTEQQESGGCIVPLSQKQGPLVALEWISPKQGEKAPGPRNDLAA